MQIQNTIQKCDNTLLFQHVCIVLYRRSMALALHISRISCFLNLDFTDNQNMFLRFFSTDAAITIRLYIRYVALSSSTAGIY